jgi:flagellar biosynthetic protein FliQ
MVLTMGQEALIMLLSSPGPWCCTDRGLARQPFSGVTQINEATLAFVPKLVAAVPFFPSGLRGC